jgi:hypothetical protein
MDNNCSICNDECGIRCICQICEASTCINHLHECVECGREICIDCAIWDEDDHPHCNNDCDCDCE